MMLPHPPLDLQVVFLLAQDQASLEAERQKINSVVRNLQRELQETSEETAHWKEMFQRNKEELRNTKQE